MRKVNDNVEDFVKKWNNNPNVDNEILVREWLDEKDVSVDTKSFVRRLFGPIISKSSV